MTTDARDGEGAAAPGTTVPLVRVARGRPGPEELAAVAALAAVLLARTPAVTPDERTAAVPAPWERPERRAFHRSPSDWRC